MGCINICSFVFASAPSLGLISLDAEISDDLTELCLVLSSILQEFVLQQLICTPSLLWVLDECLVHEVLEDG